MMKEFKGRVVSGGTIEAEAVVSHQGLNTLASFQKALQFGDKNATCGSRCYIAGWVVQVKTSEKCIVNSLVALGRSFCHRYKTAH